MEQFKGTQGEWATERRYDKEYDQPVVQINASGMEGIATVWSGGDNMDDTTLADAQAISAVPNFIEACMAVINAVSFGEARHAESLCQAALAKALTIQ